VGPLLVTVSQRPALVNHEDKDAVRRNGQNRRSRRPHGLRASLCGRTVLRRRCATARFLGLRVRIPQKAWMSVSCVCYALIGRGPCVWAYHLSPGGLPSVMCLSMIAEHRQW
jgi:hypothetical protein